MQTHAAAKESASHASTPFFGSPARSTPFFSPKLTIGTPGDHFEREADSVADAVVQRKPVRVAGAATPSLQAKCAKCEHEDAVQRQADGSGSDSGAHVASSVQQGLAEQRGAGQSLDASVRHEMEQGIGADFSGVRIHTGAPAASLNDQVHARAFTHGQDVFFNSGEFEPHTSAGRHLLAHELTHVVQQSGGSPLIQRDEAGGGSTEFSDTVSSTSRTSDSPVISGTVTRTETAPASGSLKREVVHTGTMNIAFDPTTCAVTIPFGYQFVQADPAQPGVCDAGPAPALMSTTAFNALKASVLSAVNAGLNGWFEVQLSGNSCPSGCAGRPLPIRVVAVERNTNPDTTITVHNRAGRSDAGTICGLSWDDPTAEHEGGHQALGMGDEYQEHDVNKYGATAPEWFRPERVRHDYSKMGEENVSRFAMFQERHFAAVTTFLSNIYPGCNATLVARARPVIPDFRINLTGGYAAVSGLHGFFFRAGLDMGIPLDRMRRWQFTLGPEFTTLLATGDQRLQSAFLLGARFGLEGSTGDAAFGFSGGPFLSAGYGWFNSSDRAVSFEDRDAGGAYGEIGGRFGIRTGLDVGPRFNLGLETALGTAIGAPGNIGPIGREILSDPARTNWFRFGIGASAQF